MADDTLNRPLRVARLVATSARDTERGPMVFIHPENARERLLIDGELAWVYGPRRGELATVAGWLHQLGDDSFAGNQINHGQVWHLDAPAA